MQSSQVAIWQVASVGIRSAMKGADRKHSANPAWMVCARTQRCQGAGARSREWQRPYQQQANGGSADQRAVAVVNHQALLRATLNESEGGQDGDSSQGLVPL
jgi:hypothetical protein